MAAAAVAPTQIVYPCPKYEKEAKKLLENIEKAKTLAEIRRLFTDFSETYAILPNLWNIWIEKEKRINFPDFDTKQKDGHLHKVRDLAKSHFYFANAWNFDHKSFEKGHFGRSINWKFLNNYLFSFRANSFLFKPLSFFSTPLLYQAMSYPHNDLDHVKAYLEEYSPNPIPSKILRMYEKNKDIADEIIRSSTPSNLKNLSKIGNKKLIIENYESFIGFYPTNKNIWKEYIKYLKSIDDEYEKLLTLYSRFCRLFIDDVVIRNEYKFEIIRHTQKERNVTKFWIDRIQIEESFAEINNSPKILNSLLKLLTKSSFQDKNLVVFSLWYEKKYGNTQSFELHYSWCIQNFPKMKLLLSEIPEKFDGIIKCPIKFKYKNKFNIREKPKQVSPRIINDPIVTQNFKLPSPLFYYIYKNSKKSILFKLIQTCKTLFLREMPLLCHNLKITNDQITQPTYVSRSLYITSKNLDFNGLTNLTITNSLNICVANEKKICSKLLEKINLDISCLYLFSQKLTFSEFEILTKQKLKICNFKSIEIQRDDGTFLDVADIINLLPTVTRMELTNDVSSIEVSEKLSKLERNTKFEKFGIGKINQLFDCQHLIKFIKNNATRKAVIYVFYSSNFNGIQKIIFTNTLLKDLSKKIVYVTR